MVRKTEVSIMEVNFKIVLEVIGIEETYVSFLKEVLVFDNKEADTTKHYDIVQKVEDKA